MRLAARLRPFVFLAEPKPYSAFTAATIDFAEMP